MADSTPEKPAPESPTTAQPLDFDDEQQETGVIHSDGTQTADATPAGKNRSGSRVRFAESDGEEDGPPKPPRPTSTSPEQQKENTLIEAFPDLDTKVIKAVLIASSYNTERAFEALLGMSDPTYEAELPPAKPPRPSSRTKTQTPQKSGMSQMEQDELYARQLAQHYGSAEGAYSGAPSGPDPQRRSSRPEDKEYSFFDDDLPEIQKNLKEGFQQTQTKVSKWIENFRKKMNDEDDEEAPVAGQGSGGRQNFGDSQSEQLYGIQKNAEAAKARRSTDRERYDADARMMGDNFTELELHDAEDIPPQKPPRPQANPNLFKPMPPPPQSGPVDEVDAMNTKLASKVDPLMSAGKSKKWQPLTSVGPDPTMDDDDPFALGDEDSMDEIEKEKSKSVDVRAEDSERLKRSSIAAGSGEQKRLEESERSGSTGHLNKEAAELLGKEADQ